MEFVFSENGTKLLIIIFNQAYFKIEKENMRN